MFQGFNEATIKYFEAIRRENSKSNYKANEQYYFEGVKDPLEELYYELFNYFGTVDGQLLSSKRRCISSAYNLSFQEHIKAEQRKKLNNEKIQTSKQFMHSFCV